MRRTQPDTPFMQAGVTLVELMVTVAVMFVLCALASPGFVAAIDKARLRGAADAVVDHMAQARQVAVKFDRDVVVSMQGVGPSWCIGAREAATPAIGSAVAHGRRPRRRGCVRAAAPMRRVTM